MASQRRTFLGVTLLIAIQLLGGLGMESLIPSAKEGPILLSAVLGFLSGFVGSTVARGSFVVPAAAAWLGMWALTVLILYGMAARVTTPSLAQVGTFHVTHAWPIFVSAASVIAGAVTGDIIRTRLRPVPAAA